MTDKSHVESNHREVVIINRNYPPRPGVTGESACELARYLQDECGMLVEVLTVRSNYTSVGSTLNPVGTVREIGSSYDGKGKLRRIYGSLVESFRLIWKTRRSNKPVIVMTDPPFLSFWAAILLGRKRNWTLWAMDLYPDAFVSGNLVSDRNWCYRLVSYLVYRRPPNFLIALGPLQYQYLTSRYKSNIPFAILPCGVYQPQKISEQPTLSWKTLHADKIILGYCGNLGEAHSTEFLRAVIRNLDREKFHLVLSMYGSKAQQVLDEIDVNDKGITLVKSVPRSHLCLIDIHLVSLLSHWSNICVPSKAVSAVCAASTFLFFGSADCDNWHLLQSAGWHIPEIDSSPDLNLELSAFMQNISKQDIAEKRQQAARLSIELQKIVSRGFHDIAAQLLVDRNENSA